MAAENAPAWDDIDIDEPDMFSDLMHLADTLYEQGYLVTSSIVANVAETFVKAQDDVSTVFAIAETMDRSDLIAPGRQIPACGQEAGSTVTPPEEQ